MNTRHKILTALALVGLVIAGALAQQGGGIQGGSGSGGGFSSGTSFTVSWGSGGSQACSATSDQTWKYYSSGTVVMLVPTSELSCTGSSTAFISAPNAIPVAIRQNTSQPVFLGLVRTQNNGADLGGCLYIETDFSMTIRVVQTNGLCSGTGSSSWTASGVRALMGLANPGPNNFVYNTTRN